MQKTSKLVFCTQQREENLLRSYSGNGVFRAAGHLQSSLIDAADGAQLPRVPTTRDYWYTFFFAGMKQILWCRFGQTMLNSSEELGYPNRRLFLPLLFLPVIPRDLLVASIS